MQCSELPVAFFLQIHNLICGVFIKVLWKVVEYKRIVNLVSS